MADPTFRAPVGAHSPAMPAPGAQAQTQGSPNQPDYEAANVSIQLASRAISPVYATKRRWSGVDVVIQPPPFAYSMANAHNGISVFVWGVYQGLRALLGSGRFPGSYPPGQSANQQAAQQVVSVRNAVCDNFEVSYYCPTTVPNLVGVGFMSASVIAADFTNTPIRDTGVMGYNPAGTDEQPAMTDLAAGLVIDPLFYPNPQPQSIVAIEKASSTRWVQLFDGIVAPGAGAKPLWSAVPGSYDIGEILRGRRFPIGAILISSTDPQVYAADAAGNVVGSIYFR